MSTKPATTPGETLGPLLLRRAAEANVHLTAIPSLAGYAATEDGEIWGPFGRPLRVQVKKTGYAYICAMVDGARYTRTVHRLILEALVGPPPSPGMQCGHRNGLRTDNRLVNLRWVTREENMADQKRHGTFQAGREKWLKAMRERAAA